METAAGSYQRVRAIDGKRFAAQDFFIRLAEGRDSIDSIPAPVSEPEIEVTAVQEAAAISGIINGGVYHPPTVVSQVTDSGGNTVDLDKRQARRVISAKSSAEVRDLMQAVLDTPNGQGKLRLEAYTGGGKTGTAQRADPELHRYKGYVTSYVGFAPYDDPAILTYVVLNNPRVGDSGSSTANPVYKDIMKYALPRYSVAPDAHSHQVKPTTW